MNLEKLFNPKSIAIVGATDEKGKVGNAICENILNLGYAGNVFLVNPKHEKLLGKKCYRELSEIEEDVNLAIIVIPAKFVPEVIKRSSEKIKNFVIISAGFSETGDEGAEREKALIENAKENGLNILGPNCLGFIMPKIKLNASFAGGLPKKGNISFVSQSGALISAILDISKNEELGFSNIISVGNKMQLNESDLFEYLNQDPETKVIGMYLEGVKDGKKFQELAGKLSKNKPVVILKAGKTEKAKKVISSHTGALAGSDDIIQALFKKSGIIPAENLDEFLNLIKLISLIQAPQNASVVAITNAGGPGVLTTDAFADNEMRLAEIPNETKTELRKFLPSESSVENPIDLLGDAQEDRYEKVLEVVSGGESDSIICVLTPQENTPVEKITEKIIEFKNKTDKKIVTVFLGGEKIKKSLKTLNDAGISNFSSPEKAVNALNKYYYWNLFKKSAAEDYETNKRGVSERMELTLKMIEKVRSENRKVLFFSEAKEIMDIYSIKTVDFQEIDPKSDLEIDFPLVIKVDSEKVLHKTDKEGVIVNIKDEKDLKEAYERMSSNFPGEKIILQPMEKIKTELILGIKKDEAVGSVIVFGLGGIYTEIFKMVDFIIPPVSVQEIKKIVSKSPIKFLFQENRGQKPYNLEEISQILFNFSLLAAENPEIKELDINPLLIYNDNSPALAVDVKIII